MSTTVPTGDRLPAFARGGGVRPGVDETSNASLFRAADGLDPIVHGATAFTFDRDVRTIDGVRVTEPS